MKLNAVLFDLSLLFSEHFNKFNFLSTYIRHLDGSLPRRAPPNLQVNLNLLRERSDAFPILFLLVRLPCDVYFVQVDHICSIWFRFMKSSIVMQPMFEWRAYNTCFLQEVLV